MATEARRKVGRKTMTAKEVYEVAMAHRAHPRGGVIGALRSLGFAGNAANEAMVSAVMKRMSRTARNKVADKVAVRGFDVSLKSVEDHIYRSQRKPDCVVVFKEGVANRLDAWRKKTILDCAKGNYAYGAAGGTTWTVRLTDDPGKVGYTIEHSKRYDKYSGRFKGWGALVDNHVITVPTNWRNRVYKRGLAELGGMFTADAAPLDGAPEGVRLYAAVWGEQGRGFSVVRRQGVIAITDDCECSFHGADVQSALEGLRIKRAFGDVCVKVSGFVRRYEPLADQVTVTLAHAKSCAHKKRCHCSSSARFHSRTSSCTRISAVSAKRWFLRRLQMMRFGCGQTSRKSRRGCCGSERLRRH